MTDSQLDGHALRQHAEAASRLLKSVDSPARLMILCALVDGEHSVGELSGLTDVSMSAISQHLAVLRRENIVETRRDGQTIYYSLGNDEVRALMACLYQIFCS